MHLMCGGLSFDHSKSNANFSTLKEVLGGYDLNNMYLTEFTRETINSQTRLDVVSCKHEVQVDVLKYDHYAVQTELDEETIVTG